MRRFRLYVLKHYLRASRRLRWQHPFSPNLENAHIPGRTASSSCLFLPLYVHITAQLGQPHSHISGHPSTLAIDRCLRSSRATNARPSKRIATIDIAFRWRDEVPSERYRRFASRLRHFSCTHTSQTRGEWPQVSRTALYHS